MCEQSTKDVNVDIESLLRNLGAVEAALGSHEKYSSRHVQLAVTDLVEYVFPCYTYTMAESD